MFQNKQLVHILGYGCLELPMITWSGREDIREKPTDENTLKEINDNPVIYYIQLNQDLWTKGIKSSIMIRHETN